MKPRTVKRLYWGLTGLFAALMLVDGIAGVLQVEDGKKAMHLLGYPEYLLTIVGTAKILGALALLQPFVRTLKEWAYAGFIINFIGAALSWKLTGAGAEAIVPPLVMLAVLLGLHALWRKHEQVSAPSAPHPDFLAEPTMSPA